MSQKSNPYESPSHYTSGSIECWDYMKSVMTPEEFKGYLWGNCIKYNHRWKEKGGIEDLKKLQVYASKLEETMKDDGTEDSLNADCC